MKNGMLRLYVNFSTVAWRAGQRVWDRFVQFRKSESGVGAAEYALVIGVAVILGLAVLTKFWGKYEDGTGIGGVFKKIVDYLSNTFSSESTAL